MLEQGYAAETVHPPAMNVAMAFKLPTLLIKDV